MKNGTTGINRSDKSTDSSLLRNLWKIFSLRPSSLEIRRCSTLPIPQRITMNKAVAPVDAASTFKKVPKNNPSCENCAYVRQRSGIEFTEGL